MLILILALVVLSLGQTETPTEATECTCHSGSGESVFVDGAAIIAFPSVDTNFNLAEQPADLSQSVTLVSSIVDPTALAGVFVALSHATLVQYENEAQAKVDEVNAAITDLGEKKTAFDADVQEATTRITNYWDSAVESARSVNDFTSAYRWLLNVWQVESRQQFINRVNRVITIRIDFLAREKPLRESVRDYLQKLVALSQKVEDAVTACTTAGTPTGCDRVTQAPIVIGLNAADVAEILAAGPIYVTAAGTYATDRAAMLKDDLVNFAPRDQTDGENDVDRDWFWGIQTKIEDYTPPTWEDIKLYVQNIVDWQERILPRFFSYVRDYEFTGLVLTEDETDPEQIIMNLVGTISSNTGGDLNTGVESVVPYARTVLYAYTGAYSIVVTKDGDVDATGSFSIKATISKIKQEIIRQTATEPLSKTIVEIIAAGQLKSSQVIDDVSDVPTDVETQRDDIAAELTAAYTKLSGSIDDTNAALEERVQLTKEELEARITVKESLATISNDILEQSSVIKGRVKAYISNRTADFQAAADNYENAWQQAQCEAREKLIAYLDGKFEALNNEGDNVKAQYWAATEAGLANAYEAACISREHAEQRRNESIDYATAQAEEVDIYVNWFDEKYDNLVNDVQFTIPQAREEVTANITEIEKLIKDAIISVNTEGEEAVQSVTLFWENESDELADTLVFVISVVTHPDVVTDEAHDHQVRVCGRVAIGIGCQHKEVLVQNETPLKRQSGNTKQYRATVGSTATPTMTPTMNPASPSDSPTPDAIPTGTPVTTQPVAEPSSSSNLIFSLATLVVCLFVLF